MSRRYRPLRPPTSSRYPTGVTPADANPGYYDGDIKAAVAADSIPTRQQAAREEDNNRQARTDTMTASRDAPASGHYPDIEAILREDDSLPEPRTRQQAARDGGNPATSVTGDRQTRSGSDPLTSAADNKVGRASVTASSHDVQITAEEGERIRRVAGTDPQVAVLRALLAGDFEQHRALRAQLNQEADRGGYSAIIVAAFFKAADRRFAADHSKGTVVQFVASARSRSDDAAQQIDPLLADRMTMGVFEDVSIAGHSNQTIVETQMLLLAALVSEMIFNNSDLDSFLMESRKLAERWTQ